MKVVMFVYVIKDIIIQLKMDFLAFLKLIKNVQNAKMKLELKKNMKKKQMKKMKIKRIL